MSLVVAQLERQTKYYNNHYEKLVLAKEALFKCGFLALLGTFFLL